MKKLNQKQLRKELIEVYEGLLKSRTNPIFRARAIKMDMDYGNATDLVDASLKYAINSLIFSIQEKMPDGTDREEKIREILSKLKQN
jgi:hypothetical protein